jgi:hypothetical protein
MKYKLMIYDIWFMIYGLWYGCWWMFMMIYITIYFLDLSTDAIYDGIWFMVIHPMPWDPWASEPMAIQGFQRVNMGKSQRKIRQAQWSKKYTPLLSEAAICAVDHIDNCWNLICVKLLPICSMIVTVLVILSIVDRQFLTCGTIFLARVSGEISLQ